MLLARRVLSLMYIAKSFIFPVLPGDFGLIELDVWPVVSADVIFCDVKSLGSTRPGGGPSR